jgi:hypothetical protein
MIPDKCPNCGSLHTMISYPVRFGVKKEAGTAIRCTACNTGAVVRA